MYKYCVFLRGINVNGIKIKMADLKVLLVSLGYKNPKTVLATGNIVLSFEEKINDLPSFTKDLEAKLSQHYDYEAFLFVRDFQAIESLVNKAEGLQTNDDCHTYALILDEPHTFKELEDVYQTYQHTDSESITQIASDMFWIIEKGNTLLSEFGKKALGKKYFKSKLTSRNMNTIRRIYNQML